MLVGLLLRIWNIGFQQLNADEIFTTLFSRPSLSVWQLIVQSLTVDCNPPLFYLFAHISMLVFGESATAIRIPSLLFGVLLIPSMYLIGKEYRDTLFGLMMAGFTTVFYNVCFYAKYGRSYAMALVWISLSFYFFMRLMKGDKRAGMWFGLFALLSVWTHLFTAIPLGLMVLYLLWERKAFSGIALLVIGSLPLLSLVFVVATRRVIGVNGNLFGSPPLEIIANIPFDLFTYSAVLITPIIVWSLWTHRSELLIKIISAITITTIMIMIILSYRTPVVPHYILFVLPMLLLPAVLPFYEAIRKKGEDISFFYVIGVILILVLEGIQIYWLGTLQRF